MDEGINKLTNSLKDIPNADDALNLQKIAKGLYDYIVAAGAVDADLAEAKALLKDIENKKDIPEDALIFYGTVKRYTVQSFTSSKEYMIDIRKYKMAPGPVFKGCVKAS